ncbi:N-acetylmuramoyl-L-alanine amidase [Kushneria phosphatilytica]|uniref:1,6-anhydro-N-acetylmuramyl-L-alanine amidase AmpD n=1 Tax=Kushneria phosphatilytica TaxID=657387 RepID=A0A1S1NZ42_9GAMM|nr:N-acetylmuramoyl-L-alanine amidase [Kushneria phosphatilytica]QEL12728.1 1,6-anhydro-N-acetylmuramyl-L-alanine amidase AmpD [Kushneria phosphatilytica]
MEEHRLIGVRQVASPNCNARPTDELSLIVLHAISLPPGIFHGDAIERLFTNRLDAREHPFFATIDGLRVSAHLLIRRGGECIQFVPFDRRAWHAGRSCWQGRREVNDFSVGIELEGDHRPFTAAQYHRLSDVLQTMVHSYPELSLSRLVGHEQIAPLRKNDPGPGFDWQYLHRCLEGRRH